MPESTKWRLYITDCGSDYESTTIHEIQMRSEYDGPDLCVGGVATASSYGPFYFNPPSNAFDDSLSSAWISSAPPPSWIQYEFPSPVSIIEYALYYGYVNVPPNAWTFEYWDGADWVVLDEQEDQTYRWYAGTWHIYSIGKRTQPQIHVLM